MYTIMIGIPTSPHSLMCRLGLIINKEIHNGLIINMEIHNGQCTWVLWLFLKHGELSLKCPSCVQSMCRFRQSPVLCCAQDTVTIYTVPNIMDTVGVFFVLSWFSTGHFYPWQRELFHFLCRAMIYRKTSNIKRTLVGNKIVDHSDVVGAAPSTTSSFST